MSHSHFLNDNSLFNLPVILSLENKHIENNDNKPCFEMIAYRMVDETCYSIDSALKLLTISSTKMPTKIGKNTFEANVMITQHESPIKILLPELPATLSENFDEKKPGASIKKIVYIPVYFALTVVSPDDLSSDIESAMAGFLKINPYRLTDPLINFKKLAELVTIALQNNTYQVGETILDGMQVVNQHAWYKKTSGYLLLKTEMDSSNILNPQENIKHASVKQHTIITENDIIDFTVCVYNQKPGLPTSLPKTKHNFHHHKSSNSHGLFTQRGQLAQTTPNKNMMPKLRCNDAS